MPCAAVHRNAPKLAVPGGACPTTADPLAEVAKAMLPMLLPRSPKTWYLPFAVQRNASVLSDDVQFGWPVGQTHAQPTMVERSADTAWGKVPAPCMAPG